MITEFLIKYWELFIIGFLVLNLIIQKIEKIKGRSDILTWIWQFLTWIVSLVKQIVAMLFSATPGKLPILFIGLFLLIPSLVFADPHLVCDPQVGVIEYIITGDINATVPAFDLGDGTVILRYDLVGINSATYNIEVKAVYDLWGESVATPFDFTKPILDAVKGIRIE